MSKPCWLISTAMSLLLTVTMQAQDKGAAAVQGSGSGPASQVIVQTKTGVMGGFIGSIGPAFGSVPGLPFSADVVDENDQFLADGNRIHQEMHGKLFRDSEGRTRTETEIGSLGMEKQVFIHIMDPVEKSLIVLNCLRKTATVNHFGGAIANKMKPMQPPKAAPIQPADKPAQLGGVIKNRREMQNSQEDLGTMEIEGFTARGTRHVFTIPAGQVGNDKPMTNTTERWYSEDLKIDLMTKSESLQSGTHVHKLVNIRSGDPDPLLFQVPSDYTVQASPQH